MGVRQIDPVALGEWCERHWGLKLERCGGPRCLPRATGAWKTGWMLSGSFPGCGHGWRRYRSLSDIARVTQFKA